MTFPRSSLEEKRLGFLSRFRGGDEPDEQTCPKCKMPAPLEAETCPECGWDLREAYHPEATAPRA